MSRSFFDIYNFQKSFLNRILQWKSNCCRNLKLRYGALGQFSRKQCFIVLAQTQQTPVQSLSQEQRGLNSVGYFTLVLCNFSPSPVLCYPLHVHISQILSLCYTSPTSLLLYQNSGLVCFFLVLLPVTLFPSLMLRPPRVKEHHLHLGVCIYIASLPVWLFSF
jgi:hypothetical protein